VAEAQLKIYYLRHAESGANVVPQWQDKPKSEWPAYVGNADSFSPTGEQQVRAVADKLKPYHFDFIAVSPLWRTRHTILPYLQASNLHAEIWPELQEFGYDRENIYATNLPPPALKIFSEGKPIVLPENERPYFSLRQDASKRLKIRADKKENAADCIAALQHAIRLIKERYSGQNKSILLVGHGNSGAVLLHLLTQGKFEPKESIKNTGIWMVEEQTGGSFKPIRYNDRAFMLGMITDANHHWGNRELATRSRGIPDNGDTPLGSLVQSWESKP
jgi:broad specificity phosphatase PhoE